MSKATLSKGDKALKIEKLTKKYFFKSKSKTITALE